MTSSQQSRLGLHPLRDFLLEISGWFQHVASEFLTVEWIRLGVEEMTLDDLSLHDVTGGENNRVIHQSVHQGIFELVRRVIKVHLLLLVSGPDLAGPVHQLGELLDL